MADDTTGSPDPAELARDPERLKRSHEKYGSYLKQAGLPFEPEEFEEEEGEGEDAAAPAAQGEDDGEE